MIDQELHDYAARYLDYELRMLYETAAWLIANKLAVRLQSTIMGALFESFVIHARSVAQFLYPEAVQRHRHDVTSREYVADFPQWRKDRGNIPSELKAVIHRTGKEIAHLTVLQPPGTSWEPDAIVRAFFGPLRQFAAHVPAGRLPTNVSKFIADLPVGGTIPPLKPLGPLFTGPLWGT